MYTMNYTLWRTKRQYSSAVYSYIVQAK
jgi:hypothetical protein